MYKHVCSSHCEVYDGSGFLVCKHTGVVLHQVIVNGYEKASDAVFRTNNTLLPNSNRPPTESFNRGDKKQEKNWQNFSSVLDAVRTVLKVKERAQNEEWEYTCNVPLIRAYTDYCHVQERNKRKNEHNEIAYTQQLSKRILLYYTWCVKQTKEERIPKLRMFTIAMLCIMREGLESNDVYLIPRCAFCAERITDTKSFTPEVLDGCKPRSLTTAIRFIKSVLYVAMQKEGGVFRLIEILTDLENHI